MKETVYDRGRMNDGWRVWEDYKCENNLMPLIIVKKYVYLKVLNVTYVYNSYD